MARGKKITVKFIPVKSRSEGVFIVYCRVTYNRKTTKFSVHNSFNAKSLEDAKIYIDNMLDPAQGHPWCIEKQWIELMKYNFDKYPGGVPVAFIGGTAPGVFPTQVEFDHVEVLTGVLASQTNVGDLDVVGAKANGKACKN